jgi:hypothetical protein
MSESNFIESAINASPRGLSRQAIRTLALTEDDPALKELGLRRRLLMLPLSAILPRRHRTDNMHEEALLSARQVLNTLHLRDEVTGSIGTNGLIANVWPTNVTEGHQ